MATIFVLDDDMDITFVLEYWFSSQGYTIKSFSTSTNLLDSLRSHTPDLLLLDILISESGTNGLLLSKDLREKHNFPGLIFLLTALPVSRDSLTASGADGVFEKPFDLVLLESFIQDALGKRTGNNDNLVN